MESAILSPATFELAAYDGSLDVKGSDFSDAASDTLQRCSEIARGQHHELVVPLHVAYVLLIDEHNDLVQRFEDRFGWTEDFRRSLKTCLEGQLHGLPKDYDARAESYSAEFVDLLKAAQAYRKSEEQELGLRRFISTGHLLRALVDASVTIKLNEKGACLHHFFELETSDSSVDCCGQVDLAVYQLQNGALSMGTAEPAAEGKAKPEGEDSPPASRLSSPTSEVGGADDSSPRPY